MEKCKEGDIYKILQIEDTVFEIRYGYCSEIERAMWDPAPVYPNFASCPFYTKDGRPYARADQDTCPHYTPKPQTSGENWCNDCTHFRLQEDIIGICHSPLCRKDE